MGGSFVTASITGLSTASATLAHAGDLLVIWVKSVSPSIHVTGIVGAGTGAIGTPVNAIQYFTVQHANNDDEIWYVPVTSAGTITLTFTWSASNSSVPCEYSTQEFQPSAPAAYSLDVAGHLEVASSSLTVQFPSLTPAGAGELYAGYNSNNTSGTYVTPTTSGYTVYSSARGDAIIFDPNVTSSAQSPITTATTGASVQSAIGVLIVATASGGG